MQNSWCQNRDRLEVVIRLLVIGVKRGGCCESGTFSVPRCGFGGGRLVVDGFSIVFDQEPGDGLHVDDSDWTAVAIENREPPVASVVHQRDGVEQSVLAGDGDRL